MKTEMSLLFLIFGVVVFLVYSNNVNVKKEKTIYEECVKEGVHTDTECKYMARSIVWGE